MARSAERVIAPAVTVTSHQPQIVMPTLRCTSLIPVCGCRASGRGAGCWTLIQFCGERVTSDLREGWSPEQISGRLCRERDRGETSMSVSH